jgi:polygalacturonase
MKDKYLIKLLVINIIPLLLLTSGTGSNIDGWEMADRILLRIAPPTFSDKAYNILDFGALSGGTHDCSEAIANAINQCADEGGGTVVIPEGTFLTGPVHLKSNVNLHLEENAKLLFSRDLDKYLPVVRSRFEGYDLMNYSPLIYANRVKNIAVTGSGVLDGNADTTHWWSWKGNARGGWKEGMPDQKADRKMLGEMSKSGVAVEERIFGQGHYMRTNFIQFIESADILIDGVTIINSPMWEINPVLCTNVTVRNIRVVSHGPNNDGCNPESCRDVLIENCYFDTGDDCIAIKSGREEDGRRVNVPSENIIVRNCQMKDGHGGVVIGSEISGGCRNVFIENCTMDSPNLDRALRIKSNSLRGGVIENIYMRNVTIGEVKEAILHVNLYYEEGDVGTYTPLVKNIFIQNVTSEKSEYALWVKGYQRSPVSGIYISDCRFSGVENGNLLSEVVNLEVENSFINDEVFDNESSSHSDELKKANP